MGAVAWLLTVFGATAGEALMSGVLVAVTVFVCTSLYVGQSAILKFDLAIGTLVVAVTALGYGITTLADGDGKLSGVALTVALLSAVVLPSQAVLSRLHLHRRTSAR
jgi:hypothetical protein